MSEVVTQAGVPAYPAPEDVTLANSFALPFGAQRPWQVFPDDLSNH